MDEEQRQRAERIHREAMRDHPFVGDGPYCEARIGFAPMGGPETGVITGWSGCGYPADLHPASDWDRAAAVREDWARTQVKKAGHDWRTHLVKFDGTVLPR